MQQAYHLDSRPGRCPQSVCSIAEYFQASLEEQSDQGEIHHIEGVLARCILLLCTLGCYAFEVSSLLDAIVPDPSGIYLPLMLRWGFWLHLWLEKHGESGGIPEGNNSRPHGPFGIFA